MFSTIDTIQKHQLLKQNIGCAVSGGSDSMSLLYLMQCLQKKYNFNLVCINIEHGIRGDSSRRDSDFVRSYCDKHKMEFVGKSVDAVKFAKANKMTVEQAARSLRYDFFYKLISRQKCDTIFVAHNKNDNVESILLNLFRGSGPKGVCGMDIDNGKGIARPMLNTDKSEIWQYIKSNNIPYVEDDTNADTTYTRNFLRAEVLPQIKCRFSGAEDNVLRFSKVIKAEDDFLDELASGFIKKVSGGYKISLPVKDVLLSRAVMLACKLLGANADIFETHIQSVLKLADGKNGNFVNLSNNIVAHKDYNGIFLERKISDDASSNMLSGNGKDTSDLNFDNSNLREISFKMGESTFGDYVINIEKTKNFNFKDKALYINGAMIDETTVIRGRKSGDIFKRYGGKTKLLSDYLIDLKVPKRERDKLAIVAKKNSEYVLAVLPYDIADDLKIDKNTQTIYKITFHRRTK